MHATSEVCQIALNEILRNSDDGLFVISRDRRFLVFSEGCERITGYPRGMVLESLGFGHSGVEFRDSAARSLAGALCPSMQVFKAGRAGGRQRVCVRHRDGQHVWIETTYSAIYNSDGNVTGIVGIIREITDTQDMEDELRTTTERNLGAGADRARTGLPVAGGGAMEEDEDVTDDGVGSLDRILTTIERREILGALNRANGQRTLAARLLGISRSRLYRRMEALGIDPRKVGPGDAI